MSLSNRPEIIEAVRKHKNDPTWDTRFWQGKNGRLYSKTTAYERPSKSASRPRSSLGKSKGPKKSDSKKATKRRKGSRSSRVAGLPESEGVVSKVATYLGTYIVLPEHSLLVVANWIVASYFMELWDRFPHLAITSPEKRCGKTRLLQLIEQVVTSPRNVANISPAAVYRLIGMEGPTQTLLLDEAQSLSRRGSESSEVMRELFCSGIDKHANVIRCGGKNMDEIREFPIYSPKVIALIGELDGVLADRCLLIRLKRKAANDSVEPYRSRIVEPRGEDLRDKLETWADEHGERVEQIYDELEPFPIENDRLAELLLPLQAVLSVANPGLLSELEAYASGLDEDEEERLSDGVLLLKACKELFGSMKRKSKKSSSFINTSSLINKLKAREEEPWGNYRRGSVITAQQLATLLRPYGIQPGRRQKKTLGKNKTVRGYNEADFHESWERYLPKPD